VNPITFFQGTASVTSPSPNQPPQPAKAKDQNKETDRGGLEEIS